MKRNEKNMTFQYSSACKTGLRIDIKILIHRNTALYMGLKNIGPCSLKTVGGDKF